MPIYIAERFYRSVADFIAHWYVGGFRYFFKHAMAVLKGLDRTFAVRVNIRNIFEPLYQDRSFLGHVFGFLMRSTKIVIGSFVYLLIMTVTFTFYILWALSLPYIVLFKIIRING